MRRAEFVHLHVHSQYSFLDGALRVKDLIKRAKDQHFPAVALTDHGNMFGAFGFYKTCKELGLKAIIGCELNVVSSEQPNARKDPTSGSGQHLVLLAKNEIGYQNLIYLVSMGYVEGKSNEGVPRIDFDLLSKHTQGLIGLSGCMGGVVPQAILEQGEEHGLRVATRYKEIFEPASFYLELQDHGLPEQPILNQILRTIGHTIELPRVVTNDVHYGARDDAGAHLYLTCIGSGSSYDSAKETYHGSEEMYFKSSAEMIQVFADDPEALKNTLAIAEACDLKLKLGIPMLPTFSVPEGTSLNEYFRYVSQQGLEKRFEEFSRIQKNIDFDFYRQRLQMELDVISSMNFAGYFLIVWDFIRYAKEHAIPVGPGRGSGAGSLVAYALRITDIDPIPYNLLFERFLNPERVSMPDFDIDFCMDKRQHVIDYVADKYGKTSVGQIATFAELRAKSVLKDVGRTMGIAPVETQRLANLIPMKAPGQTYTIPESIEREPKLQTLVETDARIAELMAQAAKLEGLTRQAGMHAAGVVISEGALWDHVPCFTGVNNELVTQYYKDDVEAAGLVKFDFLGLKTLTVLDLTLQLINARPDVKMRIAQGERPFDIETIPMDDTATFQLLQSGETKGVFQLESSGMQNLFKDLKPDGFEDIVAAVALYRPGPLGTGMVKDFVDCRHGRKPIASLHPLVDELLKPTHGVIVYQEQVMQIAQKLAGYTLGGADLLRRAMGKKKPEEMAKQKSVFVEGAIQNNVSAQDAERIFELLEYFAGYGFNKCLVGDTKIIDANTGERTTIFELFKSKKAFSVHALDEQTGKIRKQNVSDIVWNGRKPVFKIQTAQGKSILATANHPFRTWEGWKTLDQLKIGEFIATPRQLAVSTSKRWPAHELIVLAGLISEGNTCHPTGLYFYNNDLSFVEDFVRAVTQFSGTIACVSQRRNNRFEVCVSTGIDTRFRKGQRPWNATHVEGNTALASTQPIHRSGAFAWASALKLIGVKAINKTIPEEVFALCDENLALFLGRLWSGDGFIANATNKTPFYATSSKKLAYDLQLLLLRLGILSGIHCKTFKYRKEDRSGYTVHLVGENAIEIFLEKIAPYCVGRTHAIEQLQQYIDSLTCKFTNIDVIPSAVRSYVDEARKAQKISWTHIEKQSGVCVRKFYGQGSKKKKGFRRKTIFQLANCLSSKQRMQIATSDVFWDPIVSIEPYGIQDTFDLTVEHDHNFVADGIFVHNSHSAAYGLITYQTAYLKAHYPVEFLCASLTTDKDKIEKVVRLIAEGRAMEVTILPPDLNESGVDFSVVYASPKGDAKIERNAKIQDKLAPRIRFGLGAVRGIGEAAIEAILDARKDGTFKDLFDFAARIDARKLNKSVLEALIWSGAMDAILQPLGVSRASANASIELALERARSASKDRTAGQANLFGLFAAAEGGDMMAGSGDKYVEAAPWDFRELLSNEKQSLGFYISGHPLDRYGALPYTTTEAARELSERTKVRVAGVVEGYRERLMKGSTNAAKIAFFEIEDQTGRMEVKVRPQLVDQVAATLTSGEPVVLRGMILYDRRNSDDSGDDETASEPNPQISLDDASLLRDVLRAETRSVLLHLEHNNTHQEQINKLFELVNSCRGHCALKVNVQLEDGARVLLALPSQFSIDPNDVMLAGLERIFGKSVAELQLITNG